MEGAIGGTGFFSLADKAVKIPQITTHNPTINNSDTDSPKNVAPSKAAVMGPKQRNMVTVVAAKCFKAHSQVK